MWKKKSIDIAINYYKKALELDPKNKTALRSLSMIIRSNEAQSLEEKQKIAQERFNAELSLALYKEEAACGAAISSSYVA